MNFLENNLSVILGPMKAGKTAEMASFCSSLLYTDIKFCIYQPALNTRDVELSSRTGIALSATKINSISEISEENYIVFIDEIHMFSPREIFEIKKILRKKIKIVISGLALDWRGKMFEIVAGILELPPDEVKYRKAVCEFCKEFTAVHTPIFDKATGKRIWTGVSSIIPEGTYHHVPSCGKCFESQEEYKRITQN